ncbi:MAG: hypothetical protein Q8O51_01295 [bacterium]|nr:hypothetical protein [bacterium]
MPGKRLSENSINLKTVYLQEVVMKDVFVLVGAIAAGKSYIGRLIENCFYIPFFEYEDIFIYKGKWKSFKNEELFRAMSNIPSIL